MISSLRNGGAERIVSTISKEMIRYYELHIILMSGQTKEDYPVSGHIHLTRKKYLKYVPTNKSIFSLFGDILGYRRLIKSIQPDYLISLCEYPNLVNILTPSKAKKILWVHSIMSKKWNKNGSLWSFLIRHLYKYADHVVSISKGVNQDLIENYNLPKSLCKVIYNPYDFKLIKECIKEPIEERYIDIFKCPVIVTMGRLSDPKGYWHLIRSFAYAKKEITNLKLIVMGQGEYEDRLKKLITKYQIESSVYLIGFQKNPFKYLYNSSLFVLSSIYEGLSNAIIEALSCALPVISTDCRVGPREILSPASDFKKTCTGLDCAEFGILVPPLSGKWHDSLVPLEKSEKILSDAIVKLITNKELINVYSKKGLIRAQDFSVEVIMQQWRELLSKGNNYDKK